jgi:hypothetical protein
VEEAIAKNAYSPGRKAVEEVGAAQANPPPCANPAPVTPSEPPECCNQTSHSREGSTFL